MGKITILISSLLFLVIFNSQGQDITSELDEESIEEPQKPQESKTYFGLKVGYNASTANIYHQVYGYEADIGFNSGYQVGAILMHFLKPNYGIQMEFNFNQKGYIQRFETGIDPFVTNFDYIELPMLVNVNVGKKDLHFFINAGFFVEYMVSVRYSVNIVPLYEGEDDFHPFRWSRDNQFGYGYRAGIGSFYDFNFGTIILEGSFDFGLSNFMNYGTIDSEIPNITENIVIGVKVGYLLSYTTVR